MGIDERFYSRITANAIMRVLFDGLKVYPAMRGNAKVVSVARRLETIVAEWLTIPAF
ncbi:MAG: hypothetical protein ABFC38_04585 [Methanospirillum sp.]